MSKVKKVEIYDKKIVSKDKDDNYYKDKNGKKFVRVLIKTDYNPDRWASALAYSKKDKEFQVEDGKEYELKFEKSGNFLNWKFPSGYDKLEIRISKLEDKVEHLEGGASKSEKEANNSDLDFLDEEDVEEEIDPDDIPF